MFNRYYKLHKDLKSFHPFFEYIFILNTKWHTFFFHKYTLESNNISKKNEFYFRLNSLCYGLPYYAKLFGKICSKITMVEVQTWTPLENSTMWQHFWPPHSVHSPWVAPLIVFFPMKQFALAKHSLIINSSCQPITKYMKCICMSIKTWTLCCIYLFLSNESILIFLTNISLISRCVQLKGLQQFGNFVCVLN